MNLSNVFGLVVGAASTYAGMLFERWRARRRGLSARARAQHAWDGWTDAEVQRELAAVRELESHFQPTHDFPATSKGFNERIQELGAEDRRNGLGEILTGQRSSAGPGADLN